jgi:transcriptional regulator with PAS, ATPase and Fis domain
MEREHLSRPGVTADDGSVARFRLRSNGALPRTALRGPAASVRALAERAAAVDCPLLILGETGVGKGVLAQWVHANSARRQGPFVPVNCGAIPENLIDSQLFGHAKGAFSGADRAHLGLVRAAEGGTLLLDEVGELPLTAQTRLLRLVEEREAQPVGYPRPIKVDVRIIVSSNQDLRAAVDRGAFREDLFYRLDIVHVQLGPLRHCPLEIPVLLEAFEEEFARLYRQPRLEFDRQAVRLLQTHRWPGNVRELRAFVERLHVLGSGERVTADRVGEVIQLRRAAGSGAASVLQAKRDVACQALAAHGSVTRAASALGVHRSTVYRWLSREAISA